MMTVHLILDQLANSIYPKHGLAYFLVYRARLGFPKSIFFDQSFLQRLQGGLIR